MAEQKKKTRKSKSAKNEAAVMFAQAQQGLADFDQILARDEDNSRQGLDEKYIIALSKDIERSGLLEPLGVYLETGELSDDDLALLGVETDEDMPEEVLTLRFGYMRYYAIAALAERNPERYEELFGEGIPVMRKEEVAENEVAFDNLNENIQRKDLSPAELAERFFVLTEEKDLTTALLATHTGMSKGYVGTLIKLKKTLCEEAFTAWLENKITFDVARDIAAAGDDDEQKKVLNAALKADGEAGTGKTKRGQRKAAKEAGGKSAKPGAKDIREKVSELAEIEELTDYQAGLLNGLEWAMGDRQKVPSKPTGPTAANKPKVEEEATEEKPAKKKRGRPAKAGKAPAKGKKAPRKARKAKKVSDEEE